MIRNNIDILENLCRVEDRHNHLVHGYSKFTNRLSFILKQLIDFSIPFEIDKFSNKFDQTFFNVYIPVNGYDEKKDTLVLMAHHDVLFSDFDNCNDNSASIFLLIMLANHFNNVELDTNLLIVFTDSEERGFYGADRFNDIVQKGKFNKEKFIHVLNLELCSLGDTLWVEDHENNDYVYKVAGNYFSNNVGVLKIPTCDSNYLRSLDGEIKNITTIGLLNKKDGEYDKSPWNAIHTKHDTFEKTNIEDMTRLFSFLKEFVNIHNNY